MDSSVLVFGLFCWFFLIHALESVTTDTFNAAILITPYFEKVLPFACGFGVFYFLIPLNGSCRRKEGILPRIRICS